MAVAQAYARKRERLGQPQGKTVELKDGTMLTGKDAQNYGKTPAPTTPTVLGDTNIRENVIPQIKNDANKLGINQPVGTAANPGDQPQDTAGATDTTEGENEYDSLYKSVMGSSPNETDPIYDAELGLLDDIKKKSDATTQAYLGSLQDTFNARRAEQKAATVGQKGSAQQLLMSGGGYRSGSGQQVLSGIERAGIRELSTLDAEEQQLKAEALAKQTDNDYKGLGEKLDLMKDKRKEKLDVVSKMWEAKVDEDKERTTALNAIALKLKEHGAPEDIIDSVYGASDVGEAIAQTGDWLVDDEYTAYAREANRYGITPVDANTFYRKKWEYEPKAGAALTGIDAVGGDVPFQATIEIAASNAGASAKAQDTAAERLARLAQEGDYKSLLTETESLARKGMGATAGAEVASAQNMVKSLTNLQSVLDEYEGLGGELGPLPATEKALSQKLGQLSGDPRYAELATRMTAAFQQYRQAMTGAAFGVKENEEYKKVIPTADKDFALNRAVINGMKEYLNQNVESAYDTQLGSGYKNIKDYVDNGLSPTGKLMLKTEQDAQNKVLEMGTNSPELQAQIEDFRSHYPGANAYEILEGIGVEVSDGNEVAMGGAGNRPQRNKNPLNIKASPTTLSYAGVTGKDPKPASDGGEFLTFATPEDGLAAAKRLISSSGYSDLGIDAALRRWSGNGYGAEIAPEFRGKKIKDLTPAQLDQLIRAMATREGAFA